MGQNNFSIYVQNENEEEDKKEKLKVVNNQTISVLKYILSQLYNILPEKFLLYHKDTLLDESKPFSFYGLSRGDVLNLKIKDGFKIDVEFEMGREKRKENFQITISSNLLIREVKSIIQKKKYNLFSSYIYIYLNDNLLDDNAKKIADYNISCKDKLKVRIQSSKPGEILIFVANENQKKYGFFINEEEVIGHYYYLFQHYLGLPDTNYYYIYNNYTLSQSKKIRENNIKEFDELIMIKAPLWG